VTNQRVSVSGSTRRVLPGAVVTGQTNANTIIDVTVKLRRKATLPDFDERPMQMTREQLAEKYGASQNDIDTVVRELGQLGLKAIDTDTLTRSVRLRGPVSAMEEAFQVKLFNYAHAATSYRGRVGAISVSAGLQDIVEGVFGLDNRQVARRRRHPVREISQAKLSSVEATWLKPAQLAKRYNFPKGDGIGQSIGLLEFGGAYLPEDLKQFCGLAGIDVPNVVPLSTDGIPTDSVDGAEGEVMLDVEIAAGICPKAKIVLYFAHWSEQGWIAALDTALRDKENDPGVLSVSWGNAEDTDIWTKQAMTQINESLKDAAALGITVCVAAGDDGSSDAIRDGHAHVDFPSSSPYALAVGGTTIPAQDGSTDIVWKEGDGIRDDNGGSTGGGVSAMFPLPSWQKHVAIKSVNPGNATGRCVPDLAANADWNASPYLLVVDGKPQPNGGTSAASPLVASLLTLINSERPAGKRVGYLTPVLYSASGGSTVGAVACTDVVKGNNTSAKAGGYSAVTGYDAASGWGTPNGVLLAKAIPI
jgi:kumamolisin